MTIHSNGSKWLGEEVEPVSALFTLLETETLDPTFHDCGDFFYQDDDDANKWWAFGNFYRVSAVFHISGTHDEMEPIRQAIERAKMRPDYMAQLVDHLNRDAERAWVTK